MKKLSYPSISHSDTHCFSTALPRQPWKQDKGQQTAERAPEGLRIPTLPAGVIQEVFWTVSWVSQIRQILAETGSKRKHPQFSWLTILLLVVTHKEYNWLLFPEHPSVVSEAQPHLSWLHHQPLPALQAQVRHTFPLCLSRNTLLLWHIR